MSQHFKVSKNGNIKGVCLKEDTTVHSSICRTCKDCLSFNAPLGIPTLIICKCSGIEGYNYHPHKKERE